MKTVGELIDHLSKFQRDAFVVLQPARSKETSYAMHVLTRISEYTSRKSVLMNTREESMDEGTERRRASGL